MPRPSPGRDRIARYLLGASARNVLLPSAYAAPIRSAHELAQRTGIARSWVYMAIETFEERGWLRGGGALKVTNPRAVYAWWKENRTPLDVHSFHVSDPRPAAASLQSRGIETALTTYYAENAYQGHLFPRRGDAYVRRKDVAEARRLLVGELGAQLGGSNFRLLTGDDGVLDEGVHVGEGRARTNYAPFPQVVLDLLTEGGSAAEAADLLIQKAYSYANPRLH